MATQKVKGFNLSGKYQQLRTKFQNENSNINDPLVKPRQNKIKKLDFWYLVLSC